MFELGASLREARIKRELAPADVSKALRIRERYLQALEEERWELLPGDAYTKGFLRSYADFLGLDGYLYVDEYNRRFTPLPPPAAPGRDRSARGAGPVRPLIAIAAVVAIIGAVVAVAAWQLTDSSKTSGSPTTTTGGTTTPTKKHHHHPTTPHHVALPRKAILVASRGPCWLEIRHGSASGTVIYENTLPQGQSLPVALTSGPVWISFGDAANLDVRLAGKLARGLPTSAGAAVLLTRRGLRPA